MEESLVPVIIVNFQFSGKKLAERLGLGPQVRRIEDLQKKEDERAKNQNPTVQREHRADTGKPGLGKSGEDKLRMDFFIRDLLAAGYKLIDAYSEPKYRVVNRKVTNEKVGTVARFVFALNGEPNFEKPEDQDDIPLDLLDELADFVAPLVFLWRNSAPDGTRTTDTVNVVPLYDSDERFGRAGDPCSLRFEGGKYRIVSWCPGQEYKPTI